jgi:hypothetical protein
VRNVSVSPLAGHQFPAATRALLLIAGAAALLCGLYGRFKGIGTWPLGVDEFYISRSIDNILRTGLPAFPCGGYYTRGLIYQYTVAGLRLCGWSPEVAGRFVAAMSSLAVLPAVYLLGRRVQGSLAGWLTVIILCVSIWEIEMARFARMYAPFQAVFAWYLVAYLKFTVDKSAAALRWMIGLSVLGVLTWEGGVLLGFANIFAVLVSQENGRLKARDWRRIALFCLLAAAFFLASRDLRGFTYPPPTDADAVEEPVSRLHFVAVWFAPLWRHPASICGLLVPMALSVPALRWIGSFRDRPLVFCGLCLALAAAAVHALLAAAACVVLMLLTGLVDRHALCSRQARYFWLAFCVFALFWAAAGALSGDFAQAEMPGSSLQADIAGTLGRLFDFPDVYDQVLRPWTRTLPVLSLGLFAAFAYLCWDSIRVSRQRPDAVSVLLSLAIVLVLAVGATPIGRMETRYTFFLYPALILLTVCAILSVLRRLGGLRIPAVLVAGAPLLCFAATEDFQPRHVLDVDSERINFRVGMPRHWAEHFYPRNDIRGVAQFLAANVRPGDVVITGIPSLDEYYGNIDYFFLDEDDPRYETYVCRDERTERWTNRPVLYTAAALKPIVASGRRVFATLYVADERGLTERAASSGWSVTREWTANSRTADVILIVAQPDGARTR